MSLLSAVLQEANKINTEDITKTRNELLPKIIDLSERLQVFSWGLQNYYMDLYLTSDSSRSLEQMNYRNRKYRAESDLDELEDEIKDYRKVFGEKNEEINNACKKLDAAVKNYNDSCTLVDGTYILKSAARDLRSYNYVDAIVKLQELHKRLDQLTFQGNLATAMCSFRDISENQLALSQGQLSFEFSNIFQWNSIKGINTHTYSLLVQQNDPILVENVLQALYIGDQMIIEIQPFSRFFVTIMVPQIIRHNCDIFTEDRVGSLVFNVKIDLKDAQRPSIPTIFNNLTATFEFLETTLGAKLDADKKFFECLGDCNREEFFCTLIQDCIKTNLPYCKNTHETYKEIALELETFNKLLVDLSYVKPEKSPLKKYIDHTDLLLYDTKCRKMLIEVREMMKDYLAQTTISVGTLPDADKSMLNVTSKSFKYDLNTPLFFPKCVISQNVKEIAIIVTTYLEESVKLPVEYTNQLVPCIKDIAIMYPNLAIQRNADKLLKHPFELALFFNNCHYLAHSLLGPPWKNILPKTIADQLNTTLMSYIYDLRIIGIEKLSIFLKRNKEAIRVKIAGSFQHWESEAFEEFNRSVNDVLASIRDLKEAWYDVLPERMYRRAMRSLLDAACEAMLRRALAGGHEVTEDVVGLLAARFQFAVDEILEIYPEVNGVKSEVKSWEKMTLIPKLFTGQLSEIARKWNDGNTLKGKFSCDEVRLIIKMRFPNNEHRLKILKEIQ